MNNKYPEFTRCLVMLPHKYLCCNEIIHSLSQCLVMCNSCCFYKIPFVTLTYDLKVTIKISPAF